MFLHSAAASFVAADLATMGFAKAHTSFASETKLQALPTISVPVITIGSDFDGAAKDGSAYRNMQTPS